MKAIFKSMMIIGMMVLGTATSFANTNGHNNNRNGFNGRDNHAPAPRMECNLRHIHDAHCGGVAVVDRHKVYPAMNPRMRNHIMSGRHHFNRHGVCRDCHLTVRDIRMMENEIHRHHR